MICSEVTDSPTVSNINGYFFKLLKYWEINLNKEYIDLYKENIRPLKKKRKTVENGKITHIHWFGELILWNNHFSKSYLQILCNLNQNSYQILHRNRKGILKFIWNCKKS